MRPSATIRPASALEILVSAWPLMVLMLPMRWPPRLVPSLMLPRQTRARETLPEDGRL
jgi:hypothetical protein